MVDRITTINQKRSTLKSQITLLRNALAQNKLDHVNANLRLDRLTELFHGYEELHDELSILDSENVGLQQMEEVRDSFYDVSVRIKTMTNAGGSGSNQMTTAAAPDGASNLIERQKLLKLPVAELPKFDGNHDNWLSFRNSFKSMIDSRTDIDDLNKFLYLKNSLIGVASNKLAHYSASSENYKLAWKSLVESYEKKRILVSRHYDAIIDITPLNVATSEGLSRIIDDARQHITMLKSLDIVVDNAMIIRLLERKLPHEVRQKWEENLDLDALPDLEKFYKFLNEYIFRLTVSERENNTMQAELSNKRRNNNQSQPQKSRRLDSGARAFLTSQSGCYNCGGDHMIYSCPTFEKLNTNQRWEFVKSKSLCKNCLRPHPGDCKSTHCKKCPRFHHTLLHSEG